MKKTSLVVLFILIVSILSGCFNSSEPAKSPPNTQSNETPPSNDNNSNTPAPAPTPTPTPNPNPAPNPNSTQDPVQLYGISGFVNDFNQKVGIANNLTMKDPMFFDEDNTSATFSIVLSDGSGVGISVVKNTLKVKAISVISSATNDLEYETFYTIVTMFIQYIDPSLTVDQTADILLELGYTLPVEQVNHFYESTDLEFTTEFDPATNELYLDIYYKNN